MIVSDRRKDFYINVSFCSDGCTYEGVNFTTNKVKCNCDPVDDANSAESNFDSFGSSLFESTNLILFTCYKQVFALKR